MKHTILIFFGLLFVPLFVTPVAAQLKSDKKKETKSAKTGAPTEDDQEATETEVLEKGTFKTIISESTTRSFVPYGTFVKDGSGNLYVFRYPQGSVLSRSYYVNCYKPNNLEEIYNAPIELGKIDGEKLQFDNGLALGDKVYVIANHFNKAQSKFSVYLIEVGKEGALGNQTKIAEWTLNSRKEGNYRFKVSKDLTKIGILALMPVAQKESKQSFSLHVLDQQLKLLWSRQAVLDADDMLIHYPIKDELVRSADLDAWLVSNAGIALVRAGQSVFQYHADETPIQYPLQESNKTVRDFTLLETDMPHQIVGAGGYTRQEAGLLEGTTLLRVNTKASTAENIKHTPFSGSILQTMKSNQKHSYLTAKLVNAEVTAEQGVVVYFEERDISITAVRGHNSGPITIVRHHQDDALAYQSYIPRLIQNDSERGMGFASATFKDKTLLLFNESRAKLGKQIRSASVTTPYCVWRVMTMDGRGAKKTYSLERVRDAVLMTQLWFRYDEHTIVTTLFGVAGLTLIKIQF